MAFLFGRQPHYRKNIFYDYGEINYKFSNPWLSQNWLKYVKSKLDSDKTILNIHIGSLLYTIKLLNLFHPSKTINIIDFGGGNRKSVV